MMVYSLVFETFLNQTVAKRILNLHKALHLRLFLVAHFHLLIHPNNPLSLNFLWTLRILKTGTLWIWERRQPTKASVAEAEARRPWQEVVNTLKQRREEHGDEFYVLALQPGGGGRWTSNLVLNNMLYIIIFRTLVYHLIQQFM